MAPHIYYPRQENSATSNSIAAGLIAGFVGLLVLLSLLCLFRLHRSKANKKRIEEWNPETFRGRGVVRPVMTESNPLSTSIPPFSRQDLTTSIVMPEKTITRKPSSHGSSDKAVSFQLEPSSPPSRHRPLSNASSGAPRPRAMSILNPACSRHSRSSSGFTPYAQLSFPSGLSSRPSSAISTSSTQGRPVLQLFEPVLPRRAVSYPIRRMPYRAPIIR
ncbi:hypothetical protein J3R82DRAFT_11869 [Butyriboletus roseoflavus]|nr:hypothetical protein J3R82DRAFT_11869 [Butyriboletus roseoflavus]